MHIQINQIFTLIYFVFYWQGRREGGKQSRQIDVEICIYPINTALTGIVVLSSTVTVTGRDLNVLSVMSVLPRECRPGTPGRSRGMK